MSDGFNWGLRPRADEPADGAPADDLPTQAIESVDLPTQAIEQHDLPTRAIESVDLPTQAIEQHDLPTQAVEQQDLPTRAYEPPAAPPLVPPAVVPRPVVTQAMAWSKLPDPATLPQDPTFPRDPTSAIDSLFSDTQFHEYEEIGVLQTALPATTEPAAATAEGPVARAALTSTQKALLWSGAALVAVLAIVALFLVGMRAGSASATPSAAHTKTPHSSTPTPAASGGPVAPGVHAWNALEGGECIQPFTSVWAVSFTTVDCGSTHDAQLLLKGTLPDGAGSAYPSASKLQTEVVPLCDASTVLNYAAAAAITDAQIGLSYPPTKADWNKGDRSFYCFVSRSSGDALPGNLLVAAPAG